MFYYEKPGEMGDHDGGVEGCELTSSHKYIKKYMYMWNNSQSTDRKMIEEIIQQKLQDRPWYNQVGWRKKGDGEGAEWEGAVKEEMFPQLGTPFTGWWGSFWTDRELQSLEGRVWELGCGSNRVKRDQHKGALRGHCTAHLGTPLLVCAGLWCWNLQFCRQTHNEDGDWLYSQTSEWPTFTGRKVRGPQAAPEEVNSKWQIFSPSLQKIKAASFSFVLTISGSAWT